MDVTTENAATELVKEVLKLYRTGKYFCEKEVLAKRFLNYILEAGENIDEFASSYDANVKMTAASKAMEDIKKAQFLLRVMCMESYYPERKVQPVTEVIESVKTLISPYTGMSAGGYYQQQIYQQPAGGYPAGDGYDGYTGY